MSEFEAFTQQDRNVRSMEAVARLQGIRLTTASENRHHLALALSLASRGRREGGVCAEGAGAAAAQVRGWIARQLRDQKCDDDCSHADCGNQDNLSQYS